MNTQDWSPLGWTGWISLQSKGLSRVFSNTIIQKHQFFSAQPSLWSNSHASTWLLEKLQLWLDGLLSAFSSRFTIKFWICLPGASNYNINLPNDQIQLVKKQELLILIHFLAYVLQAKNTNSN